MTTLYVLLDEGSDPLAIKEELAKHPAFPAVKTDSKGRLVLVGGRYESADVKVIKELADSYRIPGVIGVFTYVELSHNIE